MYVEDASVAPLPEPQAPVMHNGARLIRLALECRVWVWATPDGMLEYGGRHSWTRRADAEAAAQFPITRHIDI